MKFGKALARQAIPEWLEHYVDYKRLKQLINHLCEQMANGGGGGGGGVVEYGDDMPAAAFEQALYRELQRVDRLYARVLDECEAAVAGLLDNNNISGSNSSIGNDDDARVRQARFRTLRMWCHTLEKTRTFVLLNYVAADKILKKFDKKTGLCLHEDCLQRVRTFTFYSSPRLSQMYTSVRCACAEVHPSPISYLRSEYKCAICLHTLSRPVVLGCTHAFCSDCLANAAAPNACHVLCPVCRTPRNFSTETHVAADLTRFLEKHFAAELAQREADMASTVMLPRSQAPPAAAAVVVGADDILKACQFEPSKTSGHFSAGVPLACTDIQFLVHHWEDPRTIFVFDIDETIVMTPSDAALLTPNGTKVFNSQLQRMNLAYDNKLLLVRTLQAQLNEKVLIQEETLNLVHSLQKSGHLVFALTSRYANLAQMTNDTLKKVGIDFNINSPLPSTTALQDPATGAVYSNGVIYTSAIDKGQVLVRFLDRVVGSQQKFTSPVVFVDDQLKNVESVLEAVASQNWDAPVFGYHYTRVHEMLSNSYVTTSPSVFEQVVMKQIEYFVRNGRVISDTEILSRHKFHASAATSVAPNWCE